MSLSKRLRRAAAALPLVAGLLALPSGPGGWSSGLAASQTDSAVFQLSLRGVRAGELVVNGAVEGGRYSAAGLLRSTGLVGAIRRMHYEAEASGTVQGGRFMPARYQESADTGRRQSESVMDYRAGVPQVRVYNPPRDPRPEDVDPASQRGTVDPMTALYATLRDVPAAEACNSRLGLFDGRRSTEVVLGPAAATPNGGLVCAGEYRRLAGYSPEDMAEQSRFPFRLSYVPLGNGMMRVTEVSMETIYGRGALRRR